MKALDSKRIAGARTTEDWQERRCNLVPGSDAGSWRAIFEDFFLERLESRYRRPIEVLQQTGAKTGEGFAIVALQCSLIEFLEATRRGERYVYLRKGEKLGEWEYTKSKQVFVDFLTTATPFKDVFDTGLAEDFYEGVRCGLLHEARTKKGWTIRFALGEGACIDREKKIVYRDRMQAALDAYVDWYGEELTSDRALQEAFLRKFDDLCVD